VQARNGVVEPDLAADVLPIAMVDRLGKGTGMAVALAHGFGLTRGAIASTLNALCMNAVVVGADSDDMAIAVNELAARGGGRVVVDSGRIVAAVDMPVLGLHSDRPTEEVVRQARDVRRAAAELGSTLRDPFGQLEFCFACQDIGDLKLSEEGLVQVRPPRMVDVVVG
jgi:adenine deaminase